MSAGESNEDEEKKVDQDDPVEEPMEADEDTKEELCDSGLEISGQEGSDNSADVTDDSKAKRAGGKSGETKQGGDGSHPLEFSWRVLILWTDPEMHREVRR